MAPGASFPLRLYRLAVAHGQSWPLGGGSPAPQPVRVGYHLWRYPSLTATYIQREIAALRRAGLDVEVFAEKAESVALLDAETRALLRDPTYLLPIDPQRLRAHRQRVMRRDPLAALHAFAYATRHRYAAHKSPREDRRVFRHALALAGCALERGVTHLHSPWANLSAFVTLLAARMAGVSYSVQARASTDLYRNRARVGLGENLARAQFIVTNSEFNRAFIEGAVPECRDVPVHVIYEGLDPTRFAAAAKPRSARDPLRILSVGRLSEEKGFEYLLRALALLRDSGRDFRCVIVGGEAEPRDVYARRLTELRRALRLEDAVQFAGALPFDRVLEHYGRADVFALSSVVAADGGRDVTPNALIEAMAMQLAVVATKMTAIPEIVEDRVSGILVPPRNPPALARALSQLCDDPRLAAELGANARRRIEDRFDVRKNARRYLELFHAPPVPTSPAKQG